MEEWKEYRLGDVCSRLRSGKGIKSELISNIGSFPVIGGNGIRGYAEVSNFLGECAVIGRQGAYCGNVRYFKGEAYMTEHAIVVIGNEVANTYYLSCLLSLMHLGHLSAQSAQPGLSVQTLSKLPIQLPSIKYQNRVSAILKSLDDKIEVNRRINENLEAQAQALFKSWFVDFEPFKDGEFLESELGMIPKGWRVGTFTEIIDNTLSGDWGKECEQGNYIEKVYCIRGADIPEIKNGNQGKMPTRYIITKNFKSKALNNNDIVIEISGGSPTQSTGRVCRISNKLLDKYDNRIICTNFCRAIKPKEFYSLYIYYLWQNLYDKGVMFSYENGTTGIKNLNIKDILDKEPIIIPDIKSVDAFDRMASVYNTTIQQNGEESSRLASLRDTLLPKLMSGEVDVNDVKI